MKKNDQSSQFDPQLAEILEKLSPTPNRNQGVVEENRSKFMVELESMTIPTSHVVAWERIPLGSWFQQFHQSIMEAIEMFSRKSRATTRMAAILVFGFIFLFGGSTLTVLASQSALPGDTLYPVKTSFEQTQLSLTRDAIHRVELRLRFAERRLEEIQALIDEGSIQKVDLVALDFEENIQKVLDEVESIAPQNREKASELKTLISKSILSYKDSLGEILKDLPPSVMAKLHTAMDDNDDWMDNSEFHDDDDAEQDQESYGMFDTECAFGEERIEELTVPYGMTCTLEDTYVMGNIYVQEDATLFAFNITVEGNIQAEGSELIEIHPGSYITGNIQVEESGSLLISTSQMGGNLQAFNNWGSQSFSDNTIMGDLQAFDNHGGVEIWDNTIEGNLQCKENFPAPEFGGNHVYGNMEDQCDPMYYSDDSNINDDDIDDDNNDDIDDDNNDDIDDDSDDANDSDNESDDDSDTDEDYDDSEDDDYNGENNNGECNYGSITIYELVVEQNQTCTLNETHVAGNIKVYSNATLIAYGISVDGNLQSNGSSLIEVHSGSYIGGNVQIEYAGSVMISSVNIHGSLQAFKNWGGLSFYSNTIYGDLQAFENGGGVSIQGNMVEGNLQCKDNFPAPTGSGNNVYGNKEDQCYGF